jgi:hypothetical protein
VDVRITLGRRLRIDVRDSSNRHPRQRTIDGDSETGRGLHIVERLASAWGSAPLAGGGKTVWFELDLGSGTGRPAR